MSYLIWRPGTGPVNIIRSRFAADDLSETKTSSTCLGEGGGGGWGGRVGSVRSRIERRRRERTGKPIIFFVSLFLRVVHSVLPVGRFLRGKWFVGERCRAKEC